MVALNVVQRLRHTNDLRAYRKRLASELDASVLLRVLPALIDAPLPIVAADGAPRHLDDTLEQAGYVVLCGAAGSGRGLALQQLAQRWISNDNQPTPVLITLPRIDDSRSEPTTLLAEVVAQAAQTGGWAVRRNATPVSLVERLAGWTLLISGLDELPQHRQLAWRTMLQAAPTQWAESQVVVAAARDEPRWAGYTTLTIAAAGEESLERWLGLLAPIERRATLFTSLRPGGASAPLSERVFEVALATFVASRGEIPFSRAALYDAALAGLFELDRRNDAARATLEGLQLLAAYDERPKTLVAGLIEPSATGDLRFSAPLFRSYLAARQLSAEKRYDLLAAVEPIERRELARFCATIDEEVTPLYAALWGNGRPPAEELLTLGACLRERPDTPPTWTLRIVGGLAVLARDGRPGQRAPALALLRQCRPALDSTFAALASADEVVQRVIPQMLALLPPELAIGYAEAMAYGQTIAEPLAWALADLLVNRPATHTGPVVVPLDNAGLARWTYVHALRSHESRTLLARTLHASAIHALADVGLDDTRLLRVAAVLIEDGQLPTELRTAGLALLGSNNQPTALTVIERACYDDNALVRQAALTALAARDASRGQTALSRAAMDQEAPHDTRIGAVEQLTSTFGVESQSLLARFAHDSSLPLYAQLLSVVAIDTASSGQFAGIVRDEQANPHVRALAAARLDATADATTAPLLHALLADPTTPRDLMIGICTGISSLGEAAVAPLLDQLANAAADVELSAAIIAALGVVGHDDAVPALGEILCGAFERLNATVAPHLRDTGANEAAASGGLPVPLALHLAIAQASAASVADTPTTIREFLADRADRLRRATADALAAIGGNAGRATLLAALMDDACGITSDYVVAALASTGENSAEALGHLLEGPEINPMVRWMAVQHLRSHPQGEAVMLKVAAKTSVDAFTRGALAEALGQRRTITALPLLRQLADDATVDEHVRSQALLGLGVLDEPAAEVVLIRLLTDSSEDPALRGLAAEQLPSQTSAEGRRILRDLLRRERQPDLLTASVLRVLGRVQDREALPLLLRFAQDERADVARAGLEALAALDDGSVAPVLVRVAQNPAAERATRLRAIGTLLKIGGSGYRPLLRSYLEDGPLPLRLQALEHLIAADATTADIQIVLHSQTLPLPLRLRALSYCAAQPDGSETLLGLATREAELVELRVKAVFALQEHGPASAAPALIELAGDAPEPLRAAAIVALGQIGGSAACAALGRLAEGASQPPAIHYLACRALCAAIERAPVNTLVSTQNGRLRA